MPTQTVPLASHEVRWFFDGPSNEHPTLRDWFETTSPIPKKSDVGQPVWKGRLDDKPDLYLLIPGSNDMGIKWREGDFQIKGRISSHGTHVFCERHQGKIERWMKWSYLKMPAPYERLFVEGKERQLVIASVQKTRALRKLRLDTFTGKAEEVDVKTFLDRGVGFEMTDLSFSGKSYFSIAFEAFPNDSAMDTAFTHAVEAFLTTLTSINLSAAQSASYPGWLTSLVSDVFLE